MVCGVRLMIFKALGNAFGHACIYIYIYIYIPEMPLYGVNI